MTTDRDVTPGFRGIHWLCSEGRVQTGIPHLVLRIFTDYVVRVWMQTEIPHLGLRVYSLCSKGTSADRDTTPGFTGIYTHYVVRVWVQKDECSNINITFVLPCLNKIWPIFKNVLAVIPLRSIVLLHGSGKTLCVTCSFDWSDLLCQTKWGSPHTF